MASFQSNIRWSRPRKRDNESYCSDTFLPTRPIIENSKKIATKFVKVKNTIMASFLAKIGWIRQIKRENENCRFVPFLHNA